MANAKALELAQQVNAVMGKGTVTMGSDPYYQVTYLPTGIDPVDELLHGGLPFGRFVEIFGDYSTLKSYIALCAIRECQKLGKLAALIDTEHSFDPQWAGEIGVDVDDLILKRPATGEEAVDVAEALIRGGVDLIVFDSVAAALPKAEQTTQLSGDKNIQPARLASLMSLAMRKLTSANGKTAVLWINQTRVNVGVMFGSNEAVPGGKALPFYASYRLAVRKAGKVVEDVEVWAHEDGKPKRRKFKQTVAQAIRMTVEKSKLNAPHRDIMFNFDFRSGEIDIWQYLVSKCLDLNLVAYDRNQWWVIEEGSTPPQKYRGRAAFEEAMPVEKLRALLSPGKSQPAKSKAGSANAKSSKVVVRKSTQIPAQGGSKKTVRIKKQPTK